MRNLRLAVAILAPLLLVTAPISAGWIVELDEFYPPTGIDADASGVRVFTTHGTFIIGEDGSRRELRKFGISPGDLQVERVFAGRQGFVATGVASDGDKSDPAIIRLDRNLRVLWARAVEALWVTGETLAAETSNGDVILATRRLTDVLLVRFSSGGDVLWTRSLDYTDSEEIRGLTPTRDGGALLILNVLSRAGAVVRLNASGEVLWHRVFGRFDAGTGLNDAVEQADGSFIAVGRIRLYSTSNRQGWIIRLTPEGEPVWQKLLGGAGEDGLYALTRTGENHWTAVGGTNSTPNGDADTWIVSFRSNGEVTKEIAAGIANRDDGPLESERSPATPLGADVLFVSRTATLGHLAGRVDDVSETCLVARRVTSPITEGNTTHTPTPLQQEKAVAVIRPLEITLTEDPGRASAPLTRCAWTGSDGTRSPRALVADEGNEEETFAATVAAMLVPRRFAELDAMAADLRKQRTTFSSGASKLRAFYEALGRHASLTALPLDGHRKLLDEWHRATGSAASRIARASLDYAASQRARGSGFYDTVLPQDAESHRNLLRSALSALHDVEQKGECDAPCFDLQIRAGTIGGWSEPLARLLKTDSRYWEAFNPSAFYLEPQWGGSWEKVEQFVETAARATRESLGDFVYALHYWSADPSIIYLDRKPPSPDWARIRKGFEDFLRLHPRSRFAKDRFAFAAYTIARDREAARPLFQSPLPAGQPSFGAWENRENYNRAREWALATATPMAKQIVAGRLPDKPLTVPAVMHFPDGTKREVHPFVVSTGSGPVGVTIACGRGKQCSIEFEGGARADLRHTARGSMATFIPPPEVLKRLTPLPVRTFTAAAGDRLFVIAGKVIPITAAHGSPGGFSARVSSEMEPFMPAGTPVFDDTGAVTAVMDVRWPELEPGTMSGIDILAATKGSQ